MQKIDRIKLLRSLEMPVKDKDILISDIKNPLTRTLQREALTAFLTSAVLEKSLQHQGHPIEVSVCRYEGVHDGYLSFLNKKDGEQEFYELEQIMLTSEEFVKNNKDLPKILNREIIKKIKKKDQKQYSDATKVILTIFLDIVGTTTVDEIKEFLKKEKSFLFYTLIYLKKVNPYSYVVVDIQPERVGHSEFLVTIGDNFLEYVVDLNGGENG